LAGGAAAAAVAMGTASAVAMVAADEDEDDDECVVWPADETALVKEVRALKTDADDVW